MLISLISAAIGVLVGYVAPKLAKKTKNTTDDKVVAWVQEHLPEVIAWVEGKLATKPQVVVTRERVVDHR